MTTLNLVLLGGGALMVMLAIVCAVAALRAEDRLTAIEETPTYSIQQVRSLHRGGAFGKACEIVGVIQAETSLSGPLSGKSCVAYRYTSSWEQWERSQITDRHRDLNGMVCRDSGTQFDEQQVPRFWVQDETGRVLVEPAAATLDLQEIDRHYDVTSASYGGSERRTTETELGLLIGQPVYVLGYLADRQGEPVIASFPRDRTRQFLISYRSERELVRTIGRRSSLWYFAAGIAGCAGILLIFWQLLQLRGSI